MDRQAHCRLKHYENKVVPLYLSGDEKQVRILMQLVRDLPTSYDAEYGVRWRPCVTRSGNTPINTAAG